MSTADVSLLCANCGKGEEESHKLKNCTACKLVKYCNRDCQIAHRPQHKKECKKRAAELHDENLFAEPLSQHGDCPICFLRLPTLETGRRYKTCCGKMICSGCMYAPLYDNQGNEVDNEKCPFCRTPTPDMEEMIELERKRVEAGDPIAIHNLGCDYRDGEHGFPQDYSKALEQWHRAGGLGYAGAYNNIGYAYSIGRGVEVDKKKAMHYYELAAMGGDIMARHNLGMEEGKAGNMDRAIKHYMIAAGGGGNDSVKMIQKLYMNRHATKEDYTSALQTYQAYIDEIKSKQRDEAAAFSASEYKYY